MDEPTIKEIRQAGERIRGFVHCTPVLTCEELNRMCGGEVFFKCENFQKTGSFKIRGATNAVFGLGDEEAARGVATHSSGNHGTALALAGQLRKIKVYVVMPENAPEVKKEAVGGYGAEIVFCEPTSKAREEGLAEVVERTGAAFVHSSNDYQVICGQGTAALELCEEVEGLDIVMAPVGGGGLISGTAIAVSAVSPETAVIAAEPENADDAYRSFEAGRIIPIDNPDTVADGLRTSLGDLTFAVMKKGVERIVTVSEEEIIGAMRFIWEKMKIIAEPSSSVPLGAILSKQIETRGKRIGIILSGGNVDFAKLPWLG